MGERRRSLSSWIRVIVIDPIIILFTGIMALLSVASSVFDPRGRLQHGCARIWARFVIAISRVRVNVQGLERLTGPGPYIFVVNHQSYFDIWSCLAYLPVQFRFAAKESLFRVPFLGWHLRRSGNIPIDRTHPGKAARSVRRAADKVRAGTSILLFPEGSRSRDGVVRNFKRGTFLIAAYSGVPVVPISISGSRHCLPKGSAFIQPGSVDMVIGEPISTHGWDTRRLEHLGDGVREIIIANLTERNQ